MTKYDVIIIGGGPGGLSAGIYASRGKLKTLILEEKRKTGGQAATTSEMENYPGFVESTGPDLMASFREHAEKFGVEIVKGKVTDIEVIGFDKVVKTKDGQEYIAKSIIVASGAEPRTLGIKGEDQFRGKGVSYCATCDADFYVDLDVVVLGNGNSAVEEAIYLTKFVNKVTIVVIHDEGIMDAEKIIQEKAYANEKIEFIWNSTIEEIKGEGLVGNVTVKNIKTGEMTDLACDGVFIFVGTVPRTDFLEGVVELTDRGYIKTNEQMETNVPGIYAVGDVRDKFLRQVVTAAADGAIAAVAIERYLEEEENWQKNVLNAEQPVMVAFWAPTNEQSIKTISNMESMNLEELGMKLIKIDTYKNTLISNRYNIEEIPTVLKIENGEVVNRLYSPDKDELDKLLLTRIK